MFRCAYVITCSDFFTVNIKKFFVRKGRNPTGREGVSLVFGLWNLESISRSLPLPVLTENTLPTGRLSSCGFKTQNSRRETPAFRHLLRLAAMLCGETCFAVGLSHGQAGLPAICFLSAASRKTHIALPEKQAFPHNIAASCQTTMIRIRHAGIKRKYTLSGSLRGHQPFSPMASTGHAINDSSQRASSSGVSGCL